MSKVIVYRIAMGGIDGTTTFEDSYVDKEDMTNEAFLVIKSRTTGKVASMIPRNHVLQVDLVETIDPS